MKEMSKEKIIGYLVQYKNDGRFQGRTYNWWEHSSKTKDITRARIFYSKRGAMVSCCSQWDHATRRFVYDTSKVTFLPLAVEV